MLARSVALAAVLGAALALCGGAATSAGGTYPGKNGRIAFSRAGEIWTVEPDGSGLRRLTRSQGREQNPAFSPDGTRLAWDVTEGRYGYVVVADADGGGAANLTTLSAANDADPNSSPDDACDSEPTWSPDGRQLAVVKVAQDACGGPGTQLDLVAPDGSSRRALEDDTAGLLGADEDPAWGPRGTRIAVTRSLADCSHCPTSADVVLVDAKTGKTALELTKDGKSRSASFSPDGQQVVFVRNGKTVTVRTAAGKLVPVATPGHFPAWSPDGKRIVYVDSRGLVVMNANGSGKHVLLRCSQRVPCLQPDWQPLR